MVDTHASSAPDKSADLILDPFAFHVGMKSRIAGLGGDDLQDASYVFHTEYVEVATGTAHFTIVFGGLKARKGTLQLRIYMLPNGPGAAARVFTSERVKLNWIAHQGGIALIKFEGFRNVKFALHGLITDDTDAEASSLVVLLDRPWTGADDGGHAAEAHSTSFGRDKVEATARLVSLANPDLTYPVSQMATAAQANSEPFATAVRTMALPGADPIDQWRQAYILHVLSCYGMVEKGVRALAFSNSNPAVLAQLAAQGLEVALVGLASSQETALPQGDDQERADDASRPPVNLRDLPGRLVNFDVLWAENDGASSRSVREHFAFVEATIACLRPGGIALHLLPYDPTELTPLPQEDRTVLIRHDVERLALIMISRGYEVAQLKVGLDTPLFRTDDEALTSFGFIVRRPPSIL